MKNKLRKTIGAKLKHLRKALNLSQSQIADKLDMNRSTYAKNERGDTFPHLEVLYRAGLELGISLDWLVCDRGSMRFEESGAGESGEEHPAQGEEVKELLYLLKHVPLVEHAVMGFFQEFKIENRREIDNALKALE